MINMPKSYTKHILFEKSGENRMCTIYYFCIKRLNRFEEIIKKKKVQYKSVLKVLYEKSGFI